MKALLIILGVWRQQAVYLLLGLFMAELSIASVYVLMGQTGARLSHALLGGALGFALLRLAGGARIILRYAERFLTHDAMFRVLSDIRVWLYRRLAQGAAAGLGFRRSADMLTRLVADVQSLDNLYLRILVPLATALLSLPIVVVLSLHLGNHVALIVGGVFVIVAFMLPSVACWFSNHAGPGLLQARAGLHVCALDLAGGLREARVFGAETRLATALEEKEQVLYNLQKRQGLMMALLHGLAQLLGRSAVIVVLCTCAVRLMSHMATASDVIMGITVLFVVMTAFDSIVDLPRAGLLGGEALHAARRITEVACTRSSVPEGTEPAPSSFTLHLDGVSFGWNAERPVLHDVSLYLREGERVALIGPSGAGKSTLAALLLKVVEPQEGRILLGNMPLNVIRNDALRSRIAWLSQASHLFDDTLRNNLLLGRQDIGDDTLWQVLDQAQIGDMVRTLPDGLDHWLGENGSRLSGGQARRVALARVLLSSAPILVLDEPATGLDLHTERALLETLNRIGEGRTVLLITHRLTGVEKLDRIWRLDRGKIMPQPA